MSDEKPSAEAQRFVTSCQEKWGWPPDAQVNSVAALFDSHTKEMQEAGDFAEQQWQEACAELEKHCQACPEIARLRAALELAIDRMIGDGCDCGSEEDDICALCAVQAALDGKE